MKFFHGERVWRILTDIWTFLLLTFMIVNFFAKNAYSDLVGPLSVIYIGVLGLYVGTKEFERWYDLYRSRHPGELFVLLWTVVIIFLMAMTMILGKGYRIPSELTADYIAVLSIFALTQKSKHLHAERLKKGQKRAR